MKSEAQKAGAGGRRCRRRTFKLRQRMSDHLVYPQLCVNRGALFRNVCEEVAGVVVWGGGVVSRLTGKTEQTPGPTAVRGPATLCLTGLSFHEEEVLRVRPA